MSEGYPHLNLQGVWECNFCAFSAQPMAQVVGGWFLKINEKNKLYSNG